MEDLDLDPLDSVSIDLVGGLSYLVYAEITQDK